MSEPDKIVSGTVVQLKSGGPHMTVTQVQDNNWYGCYWFDGHVVRSHNFPATCLRVLASTEREYA